MDEKYELVSEPRVTMADRWIDGLEESRADLTALLDDVTEEEYHRVVCAGAHTIAQECVHVANVQLWWTEAVVNQAEIAEDRRARFLLTNPGDMNAPPASYDAWVLRGLLGEAQDLTLWTYRKMSDEAFVRSDRRHPYTGDFYSPEWICYNLLDHDGYHRGQIALIKRLLRSVQ